MYFGKVYQAAVDSNGDVRTLIRGIPYQCPEDRENVLDSIDERSNLYLVKEPDNPKDRLAIAAYLDDRRIGYVAASDNGKIWLYMTDERMPCQFIERFEASFKIAFENPISLFENIPFEKIYRDKFGLSEQNFPKFDIPFLNNPKDRSFIWFDDNMRIVDMEKRIPDFRRKLAARMIIIAGRKNSMGEYCYYIPYMNRPVSSIYDKIIQGLIDKYGFVIALPDVPMMTQQGHIFMDLHVTYLTNTNYKEFDSANGSELVFNLAKDYDVSSHLATNCQTNVNSNNNHNDFQNIDIYEDDRFFMHDSLSTPNYSESDYILKREEIASSSIDKRTFTEINKITSELYSFIRKKLFPSMELFSFLKKHTPYYSQIYDIGQYETLIRVFVIKDLGRIYKGLNHSFNFDTAEGKPLFLYMDKEAGESTDISFDFFAQMCDPRTQLEPAMKMRKLVEDFTKLFYEYDIALWTDTDFMIHSILKEVDIKMAQDYMKLMRQFALTVSGANDSLSDSSLLPVEKTTSAIDDFFPFCGITIGKTTCKEVEEMGYPVIKWPDGSVSVSSGEGLFYDHDRNGFFTSLSMGKGRSFPPKWATKGFSWENSYDEWMQIFKSLGYNINVTHSPSQEFIDMDTGEVLDSSVLYAEFEALSPDKTLLFKMYFNNGEYGDQTSSPWTLRHIDLLYECLCSQAEDSNNECIIRMHKEEPYEIKFLQIRESGKSVSKSIAVPNEGDDDFDFCTYECCISDKRHISIIKKHIKRFEEGKEPKPFFMIGKLLFGVSNLGAFYSLDGDIIFDIIFDEQIKEWIKEAGFVLGEVKSYKIDENLPDRLNITMSVSKRKSCETLL